MKILLGGLPMILNLLLLMVHLIAARSLPSIEGEDWTMTRREASSATDTSQLQTELAELSIPSYLKDMYINLTLPNGVARSSSNAEEMEVNTIQSYRNQAKSKH